MIKLLDLLKIKESEYTDYKIHFAIGAYEKLKPYEKFLIGEFKEWQECQTNKNFSRKYVISLIYAEKDCWLFAGVYEILPIPPVPLKRENWKGWKYQTQLTDKLSDYIGRLFVEYKKDFRASYPRLEVNAEKENAPCNMTVLKILDKKVEIKDFSGFDKINISYAILKSIVEDNVQSWKSALSNVKGIYLIIDTKTGKQYVGSAYGDDCIWQRWSNYAKNGHGDNVELKKILSAYGEEYKYNFKYAILEICNMSLGNEYIIERETHWKNVLLTREFGLNKN